MIQTIRHTFRFINLFVVAGAFVLVVWVTLGLALIT